MAISRYPTTMQPDELRSGRAAGPSTPKPLSNAKTNAAAAGEAPGAGTETILPDGIASYLEESQSADLLRAVLASDLEAIREFAAANPEAIAQPARPPPLVLAAVRGDDAVVSELIRLGALPEPPH